MDKQCGEVDDIEVRQDVVEATWEGPRQSHDEITQVIGMANKAPPSRHKQTLPRRSRDGLQIYIKTKAILMTSNKEGHKKIYM